MSAKHRITPDDLDVVNRAVWAVRVKMSELSRKHGMPETSFMSASPDSTGLFWKGEVRDMVTTELSSRMSDLHEMWEKSNKSGYLSLWYESYRKVVTWTIFGVLCRESALSDSAGKHESYYWSELALRYELSVLDDFSRWSVLSRLGELENMSVLSDPPFLPA